MMSSQPYILRMNKFKWNTQSVDNFVLLNIFGSKNKISKLLISVAANRGRVC